MKILFTGARGMFASDFIAYLEEKGGYDIVAFDKAKMDITQRESVKNTIRDNSPDFVIHTAAQTNVDRCQEEPEEAFRTNTFGTANVAYYSEKFGATLVYISSCGFFGDEIRAYNEYDPVILKHTYARSKYLAEKKVKEFCPESFIIRPGWLFGGSVSHKKNFVYQRYLEAQNNDNVESANDKWGCPTYTLQLANKILELLKTDYFDTFHITNQGYGSRHDYVKEIIDSFGLDNEVVPVSSDSFPRSAPVPNCEILDNMNLQFYGFSLLPQWQDAIREYVEKIKVQKD